jgi:hypothetical protein
MPNFSRVKTNMVDEKPVIVDQISINLLIVKYDNVFAAFESAPRFGD